SDLLGFPPGYLLSSPSVLREQRLQRRRRVKIVCFEDRAAGAGYIRKRQVVIQKSLPGGPVAPMEPPAAGPAAPRHVKTQPQRREPLEVGRFKVELKALL